MRGLRVLAAVGTLLIVAGFALLLQQPVVAQEGQGGPPNPIEEPPYLAGYYFAWAGSAHADASAEAFRHWDEEDPKEVPVDCARCHSSPGYLDYLGEDGSAFGTVDQAAPIGTVVTCDTCHNQTAASLKSVTFPSGAEIAVENSSARCMLCHQGRASGASVDGALEKAGLTADLNKVSADLRFINIHYFAAASTLFGSEAAGGYQFEGKRYQMRNNHVPGYNTCAGCHNQHTLEVRVDECAGCHEDVKSVEDLQYIRMPGSLADFDGDGNVDEGISEEIQGLQEMALEAIQEYAREVAGTPILYDPVAYPYFFADPNDNGTVDEGEGGYNAFTGNLLKAAYNYQVTIKDPGGFAHNPKYHIELLFDTIEMLNQEISKPIDLEFARRDSYGHFDSTAEAFRHWDAEGEVPGTCARCHTSEGLPVFLKNGVNIAEPPSVKLACSTCHNDLSQFTLYTTNEVSFPSGAKLSFGEEDESNLCIVCHQGRESTVSVNRAIAGSGAKDDEVSDKLAFRNVHYFAAGASLFGTEAKGAYEYDGKQYNGRNLHGGDDGADAGVQTCAGCHNVHTGLRKVETCADCHEDVETQEDALLIRVVEDGQDAVDFDGDGNATEPIREELMTMEDALLVAIQKYAKDVAGAPIAYSSTSYPYFFADTNGNGTVDSDETQNNPYKAWTPTLLRAAYNYQFVQKDPGGFAHNGHYLLQVLYDSLEAVGGADAVAGMTRPEVTVAQ